MTFRKKILLWSSGIVALAAALLIAVLVLGPVYLNSAGVKSRVQAAISEKIGGKVSYDRIELLLLPLPHVTIRRVRVAYPRTFHGQLQSITIYPQLFPLLRGRLHISKVRFLEPDLTIFLPAVVSKPAPEAPSLEETKANIRAVLGYLQQIGPGLVVEVDNGRLLYKRNHRDFITLRNLTAHFNAPPGEMKILVKARTDQWGAFSLNAAYSFTEARSEVRDLTVSLGSSSISDCSAVLTWEQVPRFEIRSGRSVLDLQEIYNWLSSADSPVPFMKKLSALQGEVTIQSMQGEGPVSDPMKWRLRLDGEARRVEIESPRIPAPLVLGSRFLLEDNLLEVSELSASLGSSTLSHVSARLAGRKDPRIEILSGSAAIDLAEVFGWRTQYPVTEQSLQKVDTLAGKLTVASLSLNGPLFRPGQWKFTTSGIVDHMVFNSSLLPGQFGLVKGHFTFVPDTLSVAMREATILDSSMTGTALVSGITHTLRSIDVTLNGQSGKTSLEWIFKTLALPAALMIKTPLSLVDTRLAWDKTTGTSFQGTASVANGPTFFLDLSQHGPDLAIRRLMIQDQETKATLTLNWKKQAADFSFSGLLAERTLGKIFEQGVFGNGVLNGDLSALIRTDQPLRSRANGTLAGKAIDIPWGTPVPTTVDEFLLHAEDDVLTIDNADITWGKRHYSMSGAATTSDEGIAFSMALTADGIEIQAIEQAMEQANGKSTGEHGRSFPLPPVRGDITADSAYVKFGRFTFAPAHAVITVEPDTVNMEFTHTRTCDIAMPGSLLVSRESVSFTFTPTAEKETLGYTIACLSGLNIHITGEYDLTSNFHAQGTPKDILSSLEGRVDFKARDGKIYHYPILQKIFSVLSVLDLFRGRTPELGGSGFPYHSMAVRGDIHKGIFTLEKAYIGGQSLDIIAEGEVDLGKHTVNLVVLVAPFSTINWVIRHTPLLGKLMSGTLISIPVRVSGDLSDPDVVFLSPTAVGTRILRLLENIVELPVDIISPILPNGTKQENKQ
jgi:hypothetical protein